MGLNDKITDKYEMSTDRSEQSILDSIALGKQEESWSDFLAADSIDHKEINIQNNRIEIIRSPGIFAPFRPSGKITIDIISDSGSQTNLICEILPYNGNFPIYIGFLVSALTFWSLFVLLVSHHFDAFLMILMAWVMFGLIAFINFRFTKWRLMDYSKMVIKEITRDKKARHR